MTRAATAILSGLNALVAWPLWALFWLYKRIVSPWLPPACRHEPTCSVYAMQALRVHFVPKALLLIVWRLWRCQPRYPCGFDPVPPRGLWPPSWPWGPRADPPDEA